MTDITPAEGQSTTAELNQPELSAAEIDTQGKILFLLGVFPYQSRSMLQVALGPGLPPALWDPILGSLVSDGQVLKRDVTVIDHRQRESVKTVYHLPIYPWPPVTIEQLNNPSTPDTAEQPNTTANAA